MPLAHHCRISGDIATAAVLVSLLFALKVPQDKILLFGGAESLRDKSDYEAVYVGDSHLKSEENCRAMIPVFGKLPSLRQVLMRMLSLKLSFACGLGICFRCRPRQQILSMVWFQVVAKS